MYLQGGNNLGRTDPLSFFHVSVIYKTKHWVVKNNPKTYHHHHQENPKPTKHKTKPNKQKKQGYLFFSSSDIFQKLE